MSYHALISVSFTCMFFFTLTEASDKSHIGCDNVGTKIYLFGGKNKKVLNLGPNQRTL